MYHSNFFLFFLLYFLLSTSVLIIIDPKYSANNENVSKLNLLKQLNYNNVGVFTKCCQQFIKCTPKKRCSSNQYFFKALKIRSLDIQSKSILAFRFSPHAIVLFSIFHRKISSSGKWKRSFVEGKLPLKMSWTVVFISSGQPWRVSHEIFILRNMNSTFRTSQTYRNGH